MKNPDRILNIVLILCIGSFFLLLYIFAIAITPEKTKESTYVLEVTPAQDYSAEDNEISFIDKQGHKWDYTKNNNICYYSGDEHLLVMTDNATPDNIRDDKIISIY